MIQGQIWAAGQSDRTRYIPVTYSFIKFIWEPEWDVRNVYVWCWTESRINHCFILKSLRSISSCNRLHFIVKMKTHHLVVAEYTSGFPCVTESPHYWREIYIYEIKQFCFFFTPEKELSTSWSLNNNVFMSIVWSSERRPIFPFIYVGQGPTESILVSTSIPLQSSGRKQ